MKLIKPSYHIIDSDNIEKQIELAARTCYKSEDKITEESAHKLVETLIKSKHTAMLEHGTVYLKITPDSDFARVCLLKFSNNKYSIVNIHDDVSYVTTNYRVIIENNMERALMWIVEPTEYHTKRYTVKFITDRQIANEIVRHRTGSYAQESTRFCNYSKDKFGNELMFIEPVYDPDWESNKHIEIEHYKSSEKYYLQLIKTKKPQMCARHLPLGVKTEIVVTGDVEYWRHFFNLRALDATGAAHPGIKYLAEPLMKEFIDKKYIDMHAHE